MDIATRTPETLSIPRSTLHEQVAVELARLVARIGHRGEQLLKEYGLTGTQYNVLRILNGAGEDGLCGTDVGARLISPVPDVTRLLDRLEEAGLISRERDPNNRRYVTARITTAGRQKLAESTPPLLELHRRNMSALKPEELEKMREWLEVLLRHAG
jgi:DNA-binding MarR family transcriptional regulator